MRTPVHATPTVRELNARLNQVKKTLRRRLASEFEQVLSPALIRRAVDEAEQLAETTGYPHLVFPVLAEESVRRVSLFLTGDEPSRSRGYESVAA